MKRALSSLFSPLSLFRFISIFYFTLQFVTTDSHATLTFDQTQITVTAAPADEFATTEFICHNKGSSPITLTQVKSCCGTLLATADKKIIPPGKKGKIKAKFTIGQQTGQTLKFITIKTDQNPSKEIQLSLSIIIPKLVEIRPDILSWPLNSTPTPQFIKIHLIHPDVQAVQSVTANEKNILITHKPSQSKKNALYSIKPASTQSAMMAVLDITLKLKNDKTKIAKAYAVIQ